MDRQLPERADSALQAHPLEWYLDCEQSPVSSPMTATEALKEHREAIIELAEKHGATDIRVFGSAARGDGDELSDIDFLVRMLPGRSLFDLGALLMDLRDLLGRNVDVVTERGLRPRMRERVLREAVPV